MLATTRSTRRSRRDAFTLVEVLVVMAIIVILASLATVGMMKYLDNAKELTDDARMRNIVSGYKAFHLKSGGDNWPNDPMELVNPPDGSRSYLEAGQADLINPWGIAYQVVIQDSESGPRPQVISQTADGRTRSFPNR